MKVLALDLATNTGFYDGEEMGSIKLPKDTRVTAFWDWLRQKVYKDGELVYEAVAIENAIGQRAFALEVFHELKAVTKLVTQMADIPLYSYAPNHIKKVFTGNGNAKKPDIVEKCLDMGVEIPYRILKSGKNKGDRRYDDDIADAVAIYHTHLHNEG
jgi:Holliday junction resolvasome RuvABC endonuclease subunit